MAFDIRSTLIAVQTWLQASGHIGYSQVGEPKAPPESGEKLTAAVFMQSVAVANLFANGGTREIHIVVVRLYENMLREPTADIELSLAETVSHILALMLADYDLAGTINHVDAGGIHGTVLRTDWGHLDVSGKFYRIADITLPLVVDDSATMSP